MIQQFTSGYIPKELKAETQIDICTPMLIAELFTIAKRWKQSQCSWKNKWINKMWYIHTIEYYSALKRKEILTHALIWMNLEDVMLN